MEMHLIGARRRRLRQCAGWHMQRRQAPENTLLPLYSFSCVLRRARLEMTDGRTSGSPLIVRTWHVHHCRSCTAAACRASAISSFCRELSTKLSYVFVSFTIGSLLSARVLLPSNANPTSIVAIGAGAQIQAHVSLFLTAYPSIQTCAIFNRSKNARLQALCDRVRQDFPTVQISTGTLSPPDDHEGPTLRESIGQASIIVTATSSTEPLFPSEYVRAGTHLCLIGSYKPEMSVRCAKFRRRSPLTIAQA